MKNILYCFILLLCTYYTYAQSATKLDSLKKVLAKLPKKGASFAGDTTRVRVLCEMGETAFFFNVDSSFNMVQESYLLSKNINWSEGIAISYNVLATLYSAKNEYMTAIDYLYKSLLISEKVNNELLSAKNYRILGDCYSLLSQYDKAKVFNERSIKLYKKNKDIRNYILGINNLGLVYHDEKRFEKAISLFKMGLRINESYKFKNLDTYFLSNMGLSYVQLKKYKEALVCYNEVIEQQKKTETVPIYSQIIILISIAEVLEYQNKPFKSLRYLNDAEKLIKMGEGTDDVQQFYSEISYRVFKKLKKYDLALYHYIKFKEFKERNTKQDIEKRVKSLQFEHDNAIQQKQIVLLNKNLKQENIIKQISIIGVILLFVFGGILWKNNHSLKKKNKLIENQKDVIGLINSQLEDLNRNLEKKVDERTIELTKVNIELIQKNEEILTALVEGQTLERKRVAVELHDNLGSMLSGMKWRLQALDKEKLSEKEQKVYEGILTMMGDAYSEVRLISHNLLPAELEKSGLPGALQKLANDINQSEKLQLSINFDENSIKIDKKTELELYSICLELVNNILKHSGATKSSISFQIKNENLVLQIEDNGKGISPEIQKKGMGFKNIINRVNSLKGKLIMSSAEEQGTTFLMKFPLECL